MAMRKTGRVSPSPIKTLGRAIGSRHSPHLLNLPVTSVPGPCRIGALTRMVLLHFPGAWGRCASFGLIPGRMDFAPGACRKGQSPACPIPLRSTSGSSISCWEWRRSRMLAAAIVMAAMLVIFRGCHCSFLPNCDTS